MPDIDQTFRPTRNSFQFFKSRLLPLAAAKLIFPCITLCAEPGGIKQGLHLGAGYSRIAAAKNSVFVNVDMKLSFKLGGTLRIGPMAQLAITQQKGANASFIVSGGAAIRFQKRKIFGEISSCRSLNEKGYRLISRFTIGTLRSITDKWFFEPQVYIQSENLRLKDKTGQMFRPGIQFGFFRQLNQQSKF